MAWSSSSFLLGLGAAMMLPRLSRTLRPVAVEVAAAGLAMFDDVRRIIAEQKETLEDMAAEARARYEELAARATAHDDGDSTDLGETEGEPAEATEAGARARRRAPRRVAPERAEG
jgi:hypothetical protein